MSGTSTLIDIEIIVARLAKRRDQMEPLKSDVADGASYRTVDDDGADVGQRSYMAIQAASSG
jgi:hypothetical protein